MVLNCSLCVYVYLIYIFYVLRQISGNNYGYVGKIIIKYIRECIVYIVGFLLKKKLFFVLRKC